jgi:DNA repair exonuclease SbcCD ATPase subunit
MNKKSGIIVGPMTREAIVRKLFNGLTLKAFAEENPAGEGNEPPKPPTVNYEDLIAKARKEEKDKQYKKIEKLQSQVDTLTEQHNNDLLAKADLEKQLKEAQEKLTTAGQGDSEEIKTLKAEIDKLTKANEDLDKKVKEFESHKPVDRAEVEKEVRAELEKEYEVKAHKTQILADHKEDLLVPELVFGDTVEELDKNLESALARSEEIRKQMGITTPAKKDKRTPKSPTNPSANGQHDNEVSMEYLASLDPSSPEYKEVRKKLGLR